MYQRVFYFHGNVRSLSRLMTSGHRWMKHENKDYQTDETQWRKGGSREERKDCKEVKEGMDSPQFSILSLLISSLLHFPACDLEIDYWRNYSFLKYPRGVRSEEWGTEDAWMFPLWKFFQHLLTADQMWQLTSCSSVCEAPRKEIITFHLDIICHIV